MDEFLLLDATDFLLLDASGDRLILGTNPVPPPDTFFGIAGGGGGAGIAKRGHPIADQFRQARAKFIRPLRNQTIIVHDDEEIMAVIRRFLNLFDK